jgi:hypothetical protein
LLYFFDRVDSQDDPVTGFDSVTMSEFAGAFHFLVEPSLGGPGLREAKFRGSELSAPT